MHEDFVFFPMFVNLQGKKCVVIGAGRIAAAKIEGLLLAGAEVVVVSPRATLSVRRQARDGGLSWRRRKLLARDLDGAFLAIAATSSARTNAAAFRACQQRGVLCNAVDDPAHCDFYYPAVVRRGALQIAVSTGGRSPALAARLRQELEQQFGPQWGEWVEQLGRKREAILRRRIAPAERQRLLRSLASAPFVKSSKK